MTTSDVYSTIESVTNSNSLDGNNCPNTTADHGCNSSCGAVSTCYKTHHKSAQRLVFVNDSTTVYTLNVVNHAMCTYNLNGLSGHVEGDCVGIAEPSGKNALVTEKVSSGFVDSIQHELTHNLGASHDSCSVGQSCIHKGDLNTWCDGCTEAIMRNR